MVSLPTGKISATIQVLAYMWEFVQTLSSIVYSLLLSALGQLKEIAFNRMVYTQEKKIDGFYRFFGTLLKNTIANALLCV